MGITSQIEREREERDVSSNDSSRITGFRETKL